MYESVKCSKQCQRYSNTIYPSFSEDFLRSAVGKLIYLELLLAVVLVIGLEEIQQLLKLN